MIFGATGLVFTVREYDFETEPTAFEASTFIVYVPALAALPVIVPVLEFRDSPDGSPDTVQVIGVVPETLIHPLYSSPT